MQITDTDNKKYSFKGSLCGGITVGDVNLTYLLREYLSINQLFVFDGCVEEEI